MDDGLRVVDAPSPGASGDGVPEPPPTVTVTVTDPDTTEVAVRRPRRWLRRLGVALVVIVALVAVGFQVQAARVRNQAADAETTQRIAELDQETAQIRLDSVGARRDLAERDEAAAQQVLDDSRAAMTEQGLEEPTLHDAQVAKAKEVKDLRAQGKAVRAAIAAQKRLQPAAGSCVFDLLRGLASSDAKNTDACRTAAQAGAG